MISESTANAPLAIVGMACRLPGADDLEAFWHLLRSGGSGIVELPPERLDRDLYYHPAKGQRNKSYSALGGLVSPRPFDRAACPLADELIERSDVAHLTLCEVAAAACRHAGLDPFDLPLRNTGVFVGHTAASPLASQVAYAAGVPQMAHYLSEVPAIGALPAREREEITREVIEAVRREYAQFDRGHEIELSSHAAAGLISRGFGLTGPYLVVDAACASSLQALLIAAAALRQGRVEMAIVGGASYCKSDTLVLFSQAQSLSARGSRPFDADADGLILAEGYVVIVVKTLARALADGDNIQAVIRGIGMATDGRGKSLWAPRKEGQILAIRRAYEPDLDASALDYIEAHATSTQVGDATELAALAEALHGRLPRGKKIPIGSVKANVGHTLEAAGLSGLAKTVLAMRHGVIPPAIHCQRLNPEINWNDAPFFIPTNEMAWPETATGRPRRAGVNSFGIGGLNVHVVLDEFPEPAIVSRGISAPAAAHPEGTARVEPEAIAIVGAGCILPGARTLEAFWELLATGKDSRVSLPPGRWNAECGVDPRTGRSFADEPVRGGFITDYAYDWKRHVVPPKQVEQANPLQFMLLDATEDALRDAGYDSKPFDRSRVAVVVGTIFGDEFAQQLNMGLRLPQFERTLAEVLRRHSMQPQDIQDIGRRFAAVLIKHMPALVDETGSFTSSTLASRITKAFDLLGGALALDAGSASSLAVVATGVDFLLCKACDLVVCAAGDRNLGLLNFEAYASEGKLATGSPRSPFDARAEGSVPGEGAGVVLLKRLSDARRDGDRVRGIIRGFGAASGQDIHDTTRLAMRRALRTAQLAPQRVAAIEITSAAVSAEDSRHVAAIAETYGSPDRGAPVELGSLTSQIGNACAVAGMAGLIKMSLALDHGSFPANVALDQPAAWLADKAAAVSASGQATRMSPSGDDQRLFAGVTAGVDGRLAYHVLVERGTPVSAAVPEGSSGSAAASAIEPCWPIVRFGAATLAELVSKVQTAEGSVESVFASARSAAFAKGDVWRAALVVDSPAMLAAKLRLAGQQLANPAGRAAIEEQGIFCREMTTPARIAMVFPGQGSQYAGMLADLVRTCPTAAAATREVDAAMALLGLPSFAEISGDAAGQLGVDVFRTQAAMLLADTILFRTLTSLGVRPALVTGHSFGEFPALVAAGAWTLEQALGATRARCRAIETSCNGSPSEMLSTNAPADVVRRSLESLSDVFISHYNAPDQTVVAGRADRVRQVDALLKAQGFDTRPLAVPRAFHTPLMADAQEPFGRAIASAWIVPPQVAIVSGVTNRPAETPEEIRANLVSQLTAPVNYLTLIEQLAKESNTVLVEVGPQQVLTRLNRRILGVSAALVASDHPKRSALEQLSRVIAQLDCAGALAEGAHAAIQVVRGAERARGPLASEFVNFDATQRRKDKARSSAGATRAASEGQVSVTEPPKQNGSHPIGSPAPPWSAAPAAPIAQPAAAAPPSRMSPALPSGGVAAAGRAGRGPVTIRPRANAPRREELEKFLIHFVVEQTGYPTEIVRLDADLEADLGIDSIKKAQLFGELAEFYDVSAPENLRLEDFPTLRNVLELLQSSSADAEPAVAVTTSASVAVAPAASAVGGSPAVASGLVFSGSREAQASLAVEPAPSVPGIGGRSRGPVTIRPRANAPRREELEKFLVNFVVEQTGYPTEIVRLDADLEADLGIDSIKKAQLFGELAEFYDVSAPENLRLEDFPTLRHVLELLQASSGDSAADASATVTSAPPATAPIERAPASQPQSHASVAAAVAATERGETAVVCALATALGDVELGALAGPAYEIGRQFGQQHESRIGGMLRRFAEQAPARAADTARLETALREPEALFSAAQMEQLRGVADGARVHVGNVIAAYQQANSSASPRTTAAKTVPLPAGPSGVEAQKPRITQRLVLRMMNAPWSPQHREEGFAPRGAVLILGDNPIARALEKCLASPETQVLVVPTQGGSERVREQFDALWARQPVAHVFLATPHDAPPRGGDARATWNGRREQGLIVPFSLCQHWAGRLTDANMADGTTLLAITALGGDFGLSSNVGTVEGGGLVGLVKGIYIESLYEPWKGLRCQALDFALDESPEAAAATICRELSTDEPNLEVGFAGGRRRVLRAVPCDAPAPGTSQPPRGTWVVTGGGRGVTAVAALSLARRWGLKLHLLGTAPEPQVDPSWRTLSAEGLAQLKIATMRKAAAEGLAPHEAWTKIDKALQIDRTLRSCAAAGVSAIYHSCDVSDWAQLARVLDEIRAADGPIEGVLHGAAMIRDAALERKKIENVRLTLGAKVDAMAALAELTSGDPLRHFIAFSSASGRFGFRGQTDYAAANELLSKQIDAFRRTRPECQSVSVHWHAWDEIGLAARPELQSTFATLEVKFMPPAEGVEHLAREIESGLSEPEVLFTDWAYLKKEYPVPVIASEAELAAAETKTEADVAAGACEQDAASDLPMIARVKEHRRGQQTSVEVDLDPTRDPFLAEHRMGGKPLLPAVMAIECLAETAQFAGGGHAINIEQVEIHNGLAFKDEQPQTVRVAATSQGGGRYRCELTSEFRDREGRVVDAARPQVTAQVTLDAQAPKLNAAFPGGPPLGWFPIEYPNDAPLYHGQKLRALRQVACQYDGAFGQIVAPAIEELGGARKGSQWIVPAAVLDACLFACGTFAYTMFAKRVEIPAAIDRLRLGRKPRAGEVCQARLYFRGHEGRGSRYDFDLFGDDGTCLLSVEGYRTTAIVPGSVEPGRKNAP